MGIHGQYEGVFTKSIQNMHIFLIPLSTNSKLKEDVANDMKPS